MAANPNSYRNYYEWLAPKLSSEERKALDVIYEAANRSNGPLCKYCGRDLRKIDTACDNCPADKLDATVEKP